jgi:hypothetical protein
MSARQTNTLQKSKFDVGMNDGTYYGLRWYQQASERKQGETRREKREQGKGGKVH